MAKKDDVIRKMVPPSQKRPNAGHGGVLQIWVTRDCDRACFGCTQGSNLGGSQPMITVVQFRAACESLKDYFGTVGLIGGNPTLHPQFDELCAILSEYIPKKRRGLWSNHPTGKGKICRETFAAGRSNLNVHMSEAAYKEFKRDWPESRPFGLKKDSRHSPPYVAIQDVIADEDEQWEIISTCDINRFWSAMIAPFRGELRGYFCEIAAAQAVLHQHEPDYPDLGVPVVAGWWKHGMDHFAAQAAYHCPACGIPLRGYGELACCSSSRGMEQVSQTHLPIYKPKRAHRKVQVITARGQIQEQALGKTTDYLGNAKR